MSVARIRIQSGAAKKAVRPWDTQPVSRQLDLATLIFQRAFLVVYNTELYHNCTFSPAHPELLKTGPEPET
jgi:hypothetical protein